MAEIAPPPRGFVVLGHIARSHGVHGAVIITSYADDPDLILKRGDRLKLLSPDGAVLREVGSLKGKAAAQGLIVKIKNVTTREAARAIQGWRVGLERGELPPLAEDEVYWTDLEGMEVLTPEGRSLGVVKGVLEAGAGPLLTVAPLSDPQRELLVPFREEFLVSLDLSESRLVLDLPAGLLEL